jgi:choice-of-anchor B domain-containing protein
MKYRSALTGLLLLLGFGASTGYAQFAQNLRLVGQANDFPNVGYNDIWGYVDSSGLEYAIMGTKNSTLVYSLENPAQPRLRANIPGVVSTWRDMKSWKNFVYVIADRGADGILKIDMSGAPGTITHEFLQPATRINDVPGILARGHNLYVDEKGFLYVSGGNLHNGGVLIFDLNDETGDLSFVGAGDNRYSHDNYARNDTLWSADIYAGIFSAQDVRNKSSIQTIGFHETSSRFTHNLWLSDDGRYLFTTDEVYGANIDAYDVSELDNIRRLSSFRPARSIDLPVVPHNTHYANGYLVISWYSEGVVVVDAQRPENMVLVAQYDTYPPDQHGFYGCWGAYPFLPSGLILASDIQSGLFVFQPEWQRACYLEGSIRDASTGTMLGGVEVKLQSTEANQAQSDVFGQYKTGLAEAGTYAVTYSKPGYASQTVQVSLDHGVLTLADIALTPLARVVATGQLTDKTTGQPIPFGKIAFTGEATTFETEADEKGQFSVEVFQGSYTLQAAAWGYRHTNEADQDISAGANLDIALERGYADDFVFDLGWQTEAETTVTGGKWERAIPAITYYQSDISNPGTDLPDDLGDYCYVTGNNPASAGADDVDGGAVRLSSPPMDLSGYVSPILEFGYWFYNGGGSSLPNDSFYVDISNGLETVRLAAYGMRANDWIRVRIDQLENYLSLSDQVSIHFTAADDAAMGHLVEAAVDGFTVYEGLSTGTSDSDLSEQRWQIFPNPAGDHLTIRSSTVGSETIQLSLYNLQGQCLLQQQLEVTGRDIRWFTGSLQPGLYHLYLTDGRQRSRALRFVKQ